MTLKSIFKRTAIGLIAGCGLMASAAFYAFNIEPYRLTVKQADIDSPAWPDSRKPLKIAVLADLHVGSTVDENRLRDIVAKTNALTPDLVLLPGDFIQEHFLYGFRSGPVNIEQIAEILSGLKSKYGSFAVLGNHDWYYGGQRLYDALRRHGIPVLENGSLQIQTEDGPVWVSGLADASTRKPDPGKAFADVSGSDAPVILMTHDPAAFKPVKRPVSVMVAGHTHCGQINPGIDAIAYKWLPRTIPAGWTCGPYSHNGNPGYTSGGIGTSVVPARFMAPPRIDVLTLR